MNIQMTRLYEAAEALKNLHSQAEVARALNVSSQVINNWEARGISKAGLINAQTVLGCSASWLESGVGAMSLTTIEPANVSGSIRVEQADRDNTNFVHIKKVKLRLSAGVTGFQADPEFDDGGTIPLDPRWIAKHKFVPSKLIAIKVKGESMEPSLHEGDIVIINTEDQKPVDGVVFAVNYEGEAVVKRLSRDIGEWWLTSDNADQRKYHRKMCRNGECIIIGRVVRREGDKI
ncbi:LexA repressor [Janthinobacterium sp. MP5059B]|uniref:LexA family transcriptional regulator n=1 Tax=Janthinobacterium sp. MP5059B TaxID=1766683 RepID=UPI000893C76E|nr:S24 family peptidase [Janthinobacterium sp. MP5059B]OEZ50306.1 LexA repressor [Janthinobacterium sp. MP5059B]